MPSFRYDQSLNPWVARVWLCGKTYLLGSYPSKYLAKQAEDKWKDDLRQITQEAYIMWAVAAGLEPVLEMAVG